MDKRQVATRIHQLCQLADGLQVFDKEEPLAVQNSFNWLFIPLHYHSFFVIDIGYILKSINSASRLRLLLIEKQYQLRGTSYQRQEQRPSPIYGLPFDLATHSKRCRCLMGIGFHPSMRSMTTHRFVKFRDKRRLQLATCLQWLFWIASPAQLWESNPHGTQLTGISNVFPKPKPLHSFMTTPEPCPFVAFP